MVEKCACKSLEEREKEALMWKPAQFAHELFSFTDIVRQVHEIRRAKTMHVCQIFTKTFTVDVVKYPQVSFYSH